MEGAATRPSYDLTEAAMRPGGYDKVELADRIPPRVLAHLAELESSVKSLDAELDRLEHRLTPVLVPPTPHAMPGGVMVEDEQQSPVAFAVYDAWRRLGALRERLGSITDRVEV